MIRMFSLTPTDILSGQEEQEEKAALKRGACGVQTFFFLEYTKSYNMNRNLL